MSSWVQGVFGFSQQADRVLFPKEPRNGHDEAKQTPAAPFDSFFTPKSNGPTLGQQNGTAVKPLAPNENPTAHLENGLINGSLSNEKHMQELNSPPPIAVMEDPDEGAPRNGSSLDSPPVTSDHLSDLETAFAEQTNDVSNDTSDLVVMDPQPVGSIAVEAQSPPHFERPPLITSDQLRDHPEPVFVEQTNDVSKDPSDLVVTDPQPASSPAMEVQSPPPFERSPSVASVHSSVHLTVGPATVFAEHSHGVSNETSDLVVMDPQAASSPAMEAQVPPPFERPPPGPGPGPGARPGPGPGPGPGPAAQTALLAIPEANAIESRYGGQQSREKEWGKIKRLRVEVWGLRSKIHGMKEAVEKKRVAMSKADDAFVKYVRKQTLGTDHMKALNEHSILINLLHDCEVARNEHGPLEDECSLLESDLSNQEYLLQKLESKFYDRPIDLPTSQPWDPDTAPLQVNSSSYTASEMSQQYHPLVREYLSKMGDVDILQERLDWYLDEKEALDEEKEKRTRVGLELAPADQQWLDSFETAKSELITQLAQAEAEAEKLRQECFSRGLIDEDDNPTDFERRERQTFLSDVGSVEEASEYVNFPILIPPPDGKQVELGELGPDDAFITEDGIVNPRLRVDKWLLHQLQMSVLDVNLLAETFKSGYGDIEDGNRWQDDVLEKWFEDSGEELQKGPQTASSGLFTQAHMDIGALSNATSKAGGGDPPGWTTTFR